MSRRKHWLKSSLTDDNGEFDIGQIVTAVVLAWMLALDSVAVFLNKQPFDAQQLGTGIAAVLAALGVYKWGDSRRKDGPPRDKDAV